jgi:hypothetical protein
MTPLGCAGFAAFYVFVHHAFIATIIVLIPDNIVYSDSHGLHRHFSLFAALRLAADMEASSASPSDIGARLMMSLPSNALYLQHRAVPSSPTRSRV